VPSRAAHVIEKLLRIAEEFKQPISRNEKLGFNWDEVAFYDAFAERPEVLCESLPAPQI
jgi:type I restriction enzyme, R subunit